MLQAYELDAGRQLATLTIADAWPVTPGVDKRGHRFIFACRMFTGTEVGPYRILSQVGAGGMGIVYKAKDTRLGRTVAVKLLNEKYSRDADLKARLMNEAKAASSLNHPNIVTIFDVVSMGDREAIVMEYVEGQSLRAIIEKRALPLPAILDIIAQAAMGLCAAHRRGIVHRDIKPDNIVVTADNQAKILDFGIARSWIEQAADESGELTTASHQRPMTADGIVLGTAWYMSPEQARGEKADFRSDIFSLGVVLYEAITGRRPFSPASSGGGMLQLLHSILYDAPGPVSESENLPPQLDDILEKALAKQPDERYQNAADMALDLKRAKARMVTGGSEADRAPAAARGNRLLPASFVLVLAALIGSLAWIALHRDAGPPQQASSMPHRLVPVTTDPGFEGEPSFTPDGEAIAYVSDRTGNYDIYLKQVAGGPDLNLTNNPADDIQPSVSPDGGSIAFVSTRESTTQVVYKNPTSSLTGGDIWVMPTFGGTPRKIAEEGNFPAWSPDNRSILFTAGPWFRQKILTVPATGGAVTEIPVVFPRDRQSPFFLHRPSYSPDGKWIVFEGNPESVYTVPAAGGQAVLVGKGRTPCWDGGGILYSSAQYGQNYSLVEVPFSTETGKVTGPPTQLTIGKGYDLQPAVAANRKSIVYASTAETFNIERVPFDAETGKLRGAAEKITWGNNMNWFFSSSPVSNEVVYDSLRGNTFHIWKMTADHTAVQLTSDPAYHDRQPQFSPDGRSISFSRRGVNAPDTETGRWIMAADGGTPRRVGSSGGFVKWTPDGRSLLFTDKGHVQWMDIKTGTVHVVPGEGDVGTFLALSRDGKWIAYGSTFGSPSTDIHAMPFPSGKSIPVVSSPHEDFHPFFSPSGNWLYFQYDHKNLYRIPGPAQGWRKAEPQKITDYPESGLYLEDIQITPDGKFLLYSKGDITADIWLMTR